MTQNKITPFLWFNDNAEEALEYYTSIFKNSKVLNKSTMPDGKVVTAMMELEGQRFMLLNGGPYHEGFKESISFFVQCKDQEEVDYYWEKLTADGGEESQCGWLKDKYGLSWQIIPDALGQLMRETDQTKAKRVMDAMMQMRKIDVKKLEEAYNQE